MHDTPEHDEEGFRIRGAQPTRLDAFVDALIIPLGRCAAWRERRALATPGAA